MNKFQRVDYTPRVLDAQKSAYGNLATTALAQRT